MRECSCSWPADPPFSDHRCGLPAGHSGEHKYFLPNCTSTFVPPSASSNPAASLDTIARVLRHWLDWARDNGQGAGQMASDGTQIMAVPVWPSRGQFEAWIAALEAARDQLRQAPDPAELCPDGCRPGPCICGRFGPYGGKVAGKPPE